ncbi:MAG: hypothetical protein ABI862_15255 [Ilumatobacteraceae bacterium]
MYDVTLPIAVWLTVIFHDTRDRARQGWERFVDDRGLDEATTKMIYLAVGVGLAIAATTYIVSVFNTAKSNVPSPVAPAP